MTRGWVATLLAATMLSGGFWGGALAQTNGSDAGATHTGPMSAIDWLSDTVATPIRPVVNNKDVATSAGTETIEVISLDIQSPDAVGLLAPSVTGFAPDFWGPTATRDIVTLINGAEISRYPALQQLLEQLLLAELAPPIDSDLSGVLFLARIDKLLDMGALDQAAELMARAGQKSPDIFRRQFDVSLLLGSEDRACQAMRDNADIAPTMTARVFCLARGGDWMAAALTLETGRALGFISAEDDELLARFLDPEFFDGNQDLAAPTRPSPLIFRLYEAIGQPLPTHDLPRAFAHADLRDNTGWKFRLEAAERLVRSGAISENLLFQLYTDRQAAASGGVWDRVAAIQSLDKASADTARAAIDKSWDLMAKSELEVPLAQMFDDKLTEVAAQSANGLHLGLLTMDYELVAQATKTSAEYATLPATDRFLVNLAQGFVDPMQSDVGIRARAVQDGFSNPVLPTHLAARLENREYGRAVLESIALFNQGARGDLVDITGAIGTLRQLGLEDVARRASLQFMILQRS